MAVEPLIERVGGRAANGGSEQGDPTFLDCRIGLLVLGDDDDVGPRDHIARMLAGGALVAARDHQTHVTLSVISLRSTV